MVTQATDLNLRNMKKYFHLLLLSIVEWLKVNPQWLVGIVLIAAALLWYFLHALPKKKNERQLQQYMLDKLNCEEEAKRTKQHFNDINEAKKNAEFWETKFKNEQQKNLFEEKQRAALAEQKKLAIERAAKEKSEEAERKAQELEAQKIADDAAKQKAGADFERRVISRLTEAFADWIGTGRAKLLHNITLPKSYTDVYDKDKLPQIDVVLIDISGIYIIECKCWKGLIFGCSNWAYCLQFSCDIVPNFCPITKENKDSPFTFTSRSNPVSQNTAHRNELYAHLKSIVSNDPNLFKEISVFAECGNIDCFINKQSKDENHIWLGLENELTTAIRKYSDNMPVASRLSQKDVNLIYNKLQHCGEKQ